MQKTALVLSGGGSRGAYEIGVWKALDELGVEIHMAMGTSVGAINGAMIAQGSLELSQALWHQLETDMVFDVETVGTPSEDALAYAKEIITRGGAGTAGLRGLLTRYIDEKAVRGSSVDYGLVTTEFPSMEGRYLYIENIPQDQLLNYILASASCFPAVQKCVIGDSEYIDGGYRDNLPVEMVMKRGADRIIAVDLQAAGLVRKSTLEDARNTAREFHLLKSPLDLGNFLIFDKINTHKIMTLGYLETMRHWGKYDGITYTFAKNVFNAHGLAGADSAAYLLHLDPCCVYDRSTLREAVKSRLTNLKETELHAHMLLYIAKSLKEDQEKSLFLQPSLFKLMEEEIQAANYLMKENLV